MNRPMASRRYVQVLEPHEAIRIAENKRQVRYSKSPMTLEEAQRIMSETQQEKPA